MSHDTEPQTIPGGLTPVVFVLAGTFLIGTTEFMIAGLLPDIADGLHVGEARSGLLITAFAIGMIVGAALMALARAGYQAMGERDAITILVRP